MKGQDTEAVYPSVREY